MSLRSRLNQRFPRDNGILYGAVLKDLLSLDPNYFKIENGIVYPLKENEVKNLPINIASQLIRKSREVKIIQRNPIVVGLGRPSPVDTWEKAAEIRNIF